MADILGKCEHIYVTDYIVHRQTLSADSITRAKFGLVTLRAPETKLITVEKLIEQRKYQFAVEKWGKSCGEVLIYTPKAAAPEERKELLRIFKWSCNLGKRLFKHMRLKKKIKYLVYRYGYLFYRGTHPPK